MLGFYLYPPPRGTEYTADDLADPHKVVELFGYCSILEGVITKTGWDFLIRSYGYEKLFAMDKAGQWFDADSLAEYIACVQNERAISPES